MKTIGVVVLTDEQIRWLDALFDKWHKLGDEATTIGQLTNDTHGNMVIKLDVLKPDTARKLQRLVSPEYVGEIERVCKPGPYYIEVEL